jgi:phage replication-related protein YjqB (UPF0714/DUF867 family)
MTREDRFCLALLPVSALFLCACGPGRGVERLGRDVYPDYIALAGENVEGRDFSREIYDRRSPVAVFALHGGDIEPATARLARSIAGADFNLYIFNGWLGENGGKLHVTAAHFNDPAAVALSTRAVFAVSVHAQAERGERVCVGGANKGAGRAMADGLRSSGFAAEFPCARLPGEGRNNIVNRPAGGGVQLELTLSLLKLLENSPEETARFAACVRNAAQAAVKEPQ